MIWLWYIVERLTAVALLGLAAWLVVEGHPWYGFGFLALAILWV